MTERIKALTDKYNAGVATPEDLHELEQYIQQGNVTIEDFHDIKNLEERLLMLAVPMPDVDLDRRFHEMLASEKRTLTKRFRWRTLFSFTDLAPRLAFATVTLIVGFLFGFFVKSPKENAEVKLLTKEVFSLKEMMILSLLEKESATERLRAVSLTEEMSDASSQVTKALLQTLNNDENVNVRLAALEALLPYLKQDNVREALIRSIAKQQSPLVQIALAELMVFIQEKSSVKEFDKILNSEQTPPDVKIKIKESIDVLI